MKSEITTRQLGILVFLAFLTTKFINLPSLIYQRSEDVSLVIFSVLTIMEAIVICMILTYISKHAGEKFYDILKNNYGEIIAKLIYLCFFAYFILKFTLFVQGNYAFMRDSIFSNAGKLLYWSILFTIVISIAYSPMKAFSRTCEFFFLILLVGLIMCIALGFFSGSFELPYISFDISASDFFSDIVSLNFWFGDAVFLLVFMDKVKKDENYNMYVYSYLILAIVILFIFAFCYYGVFPVTAYNHNYAIYDMSVFGPSTVSIGRLDIIPVITMMFYVILQSSLLFKCCKKSIEDFAEAEEKENMGSIILCTIITLVLIVAVFKNDDVVFAFIDSGYKWFTLFISFIFPLFLSFGFFRQRWLKKHERKI